MTENASIDTHAGFCTVHDMPPESKNGSARCLTEPPILVVFGEGKERVSRLTERDAEPALKAAALLGLRVASIEDVAARTVPEAPPQRDIFGHGNGNYGVARMPERRRTGGSDDR